MIVLGCDHRGFVLKEEIKKYFEEKNIKYIDLGTDSTEKVDYPDIAKKVSLDIQKNPENIGILICGTGFGMSIVANKFKGIRCAVCSNEENAKLAKQHNNANIIALGAECVNINTAICIIRTFLGEIFLGERHLHRLQMIGEIEKENMK